MNLPIKIQLPEHFLDEEVRCGYVVTAQMKKVWAVEIDLLFEFKRICDKYNLKWFAGGGTMLGAVRHGGFIPWDDDIDIEMLRPDYDKFCEVARKELSAPYYFTNGFDEKGVFRSLARIHNSNTTCIRQNEIGKKSFYNQGIMIDVFPIDTLPNDSLKLQKMISEISHRYYLAKWLYVNAGTYIAKKGSRRIIHFFSMITAKLFWPILHKIFTKRLQISMSRFAGTSSDWVGSLSMLPFHEGRKFQKIWYEDVVQLPFEWFPMPVISGYEMWLNTHYGNWRQFVKGTAQHSEAMIIDTNKSYIEYIK